MEVNKENYSKIRKVQYLLFGLLILCWIAVFVLGAVGAEEFLAIPGVLAVLFIFAEVVLSIMTKNERKKQDEEPKDFKPYEGGNPNFTFPQKERATSDLFIKEIDDYIAKEYPELPFDNAEIDLKFSSDYLSDIRKTAFQMQKHLGISVYIITITLRKLNDANKRRMEVGHFQRTGIITAEIEIDANLSKTMALACLAHEMSHAYQSFKGRQPYEDGSIKEEQFTDLLTYYLGFSNLVKNGYYGTYTKLGYVESGDFKKVEEQYSARTSSSGSYKEEKKELKDVVTIYERMVEQILSLCGDLLKKYIPHDDKQYIETINEKYSSTDVREYISKMKKNIDRRSKLNINIDQIGVEMKLEELMDETTKVQRIHDYIFGK